MFETLETAPPDAILGLGDAFRSDPNPEKINLSVGVYKDAQGKTPTLKCVREAERRLAERDEPKGYLPMEGLASYRQHVTGMLFGADHEVNTSGRAAAVQSPGGTGALRIAGDLLRRKFPNATVWISQPTWNNHPAIFEAAGLAVKTYAYLDDAKQNLDFDAMLASLKKIPAGDVVCLHACCHNPSGVDPSAEQWKQIADCIAASGLLPLVDFAYQGFGDGLEADAAGLRELCRPGAELLVCNSYSKNFGLYNERVGGLTIVAGSADAAGAALSHAKLCVRTNFSNPPRHGAAVVAEVLSDPELTEAWHTELASMRQRINGTRKLFVERLAAAGIDRDFSFIERQRGMFSFSGLTPMQVDALKTNHSIYIVGNGRINVAGISESNVDRLCQAIMQVL